MRLKALVRRVVHGLVLGGGAYGPARRRVPHAHVRVGARRKRALARVHAKLLRRPGRKQPAELHGAQVVLERGHHQRGTVLHTGAAVRDLAEVCAAPVFLAVQVEAAVVRGDLVNLAGKHGPAQRCHVRGLAQRRAHHVLRTREAVLAALQVAGVVQQQVLRAGLQHRAHAVLAGGTHLLKPQLRGAVHHVHAGPRQVREVHQAPDGLRLALRGTAERVPLRPRDAALEHAALQLVHQGAVLAVHAQDAVERLDRLEHLHGLGIVQAQVVVGKVRLERGDARVAHEVNLLPRVLVPVRDRHVERVVRGARAVRTLVPRVQRLRQGHAAVLRGVVHDRGGASTRSRARARLEAVRRPVHSGPALHVRVRVYKAREHPAPDHVEHLAAVQLRRVQAARHHVRDALALKHHVTREHALRRHQASAPQHLRYGSHAIIPLTRTLQDAPAPPPRVRGPPGCQRP